MSQFLVAFKKYTSNNRILVYLLLLLYSIGQTFLFLSFEGGVFFTKFTQVVITFLFYLFLIQLHPIILKLFLVFSFLLTLFIYPTLVIYGSIDFNYVASAMYTDFSETFSYVKSIPIRVFILLFLLLIYTIALLLIDYQKHTNKKLVYFFFIILLLPTVVNYFSYKDRLAETHRFIEVLPLKYTAKIFYEFKQVQKEQRYIEGELVKSDTWEISSKPEKLIDNFVIVIGESVSRAYLHNYGFEVETTPFIDSSPKIQFDNYLAVAPNTIPSLMRTFTLSSNFPEYEINNTIVRLGNKLGYKTHWISNQGHVGEYDSPITVIGGASSSVSFLKKGNYKMSAEQSDESLLPLIKEAIEAGTEPNLLFVHMMGSHPSPCDRTGGEYDEYVLSKNFSCYLQSIKNTDRFLEEIYKQLAATNKRFKLIYFSDHGVILNDDLTIVHGKKYKETFEVPLLIWGDDIQQDKLIKARRTGKDFLHLFCEINGVETKNFQSNYSFNSEDKNGDSISFLRTSNNVLVDFDQLPENTLRKSIFK